MCDAIDHAVQSKKEQVIYEMAYRPPDPIVNMFIPIEDLRKV